MTTNAITAITNRVTDPEFVRTVREAMVAEDIEYYEAFALVAAWWSEIDAVRPWHTAPTPRQEATLDA